jgi:hypothetical protein
MFNIIFCFVLIVLSLIFFKDNKNYRDRDQNFFPGFRALFSNWNFIKMLTIMSIANGTIVHITSIINILAINHNIPSYIASLCVFFGTILGLIWSILYGKFFGHFKDHKLLMSLHMFFSGVFMFLMGIALYLQSQVLLLVFYILFGMLSIHAIPFFMEKTSVDFSNISYNVINLGSYCFFF